VLGVRDRADATGPRRATSKRRAHSRNCVKPPVGSPEQPLGSPQKQADVFGHYDAAMQPRVPRSQEAASSEAPDPFEFARAWLPDDVDDVDAAIIRHLRIDGRASVKSISDDIGTAETTVRKRLARLLDDDIIRVVAIPNALAAERTIMAMAHIRAVGDVEGLGLKIAEWPEVSWVGFGVGHIDLVVEMICRGQESLQVVVERLHGLAGVAHLQTFVYLKILKQLYVGPLPQVP